jgi:serine/threonine protein kinase
VACGLDYLNACRHPHPQGGPGLASFQHRDVKPTNLFLVGDGVKLGDWGLLRLLEGTAASHTGHHTPAYAAPEFFIGKTTNRSDQYSLAVTAYFLRSGHLPFTSNVRDGHLHRPADLSGVANRRERQVLERALAKNPHERWPSCRDFVAALRTSNHEPRPDPIRQPTEEEVPPTQLPSSTAPYGPGLKVPRFHYGSVVPPQSFIGRQQELADAQSIVRAGQSFLILGLHRAGKTSFCKKLIHDLMAAPDNDLLPAYLNLQQLLDLTVETFLEHTLLNLMGEIARQVFRCKYTDLMRADAAAGYPELQSDPVFDSFVNIFRLVVSRTQSSKGVSPPPLRAQEFVQFTQDLLDIIRRRGWSNFVIF